MTAPERICAPISLPFSIRQTERSGESCLSRIAAARPDGPPPTIYGGVFRGTDGSNPAPSSRTSPASLADTGGQHRRRPMADFLESQRRQRAALLVDAVRSQTT
jgi:hypothetical protein